MRKPAMNINHQIWILNGQANFRAVPCSRKTLREAPRVCAAIPRSTITANGNQSALKLYSL